MKKFLLFAALLFAPALFAQQYPQTPNVGLAANRPTNCNAINPVQPNQPDWYFSTDSQALSICVAQNTWEDVNGGGGSGNCTVPGVSGLLLYDTGSGCADATGIAYSFSSSTPTLTWNDGAGNTALVQAGGGIGDIATSNANGDSASLQALIAGSSLVLENSSSGQISAVLDDGTSSARISLEGGAAGAQPLTMSQSPSGGAIGYPGSVSGTVTMQALGAVFGYNFNLPLTPGAAGQVLTSQGGNSSPMIWSTASAGGTNAIRATDYGVSANMQTRFDAATTNASGVVTSATGDFVAGDVGKDVYTIFNAAATSTGAGSVSGVCQVASVQSATQLTMSCLASASHSSTTLAWGTNDDTAANAAITALLALPNCGAIIWPAGYIRIKTTKLITLPATCGVSNGDDKGIQFSGQGQKATYFVIGPDYSYSPSNGSAMGGTVGLFSGFQLTGLGLTVSQSNYIGITLGTGAAATQIAATRLLGLGNSINVSGQEASCVQCFEDAVAPWGFGTQGENVTLAGFSANGFSIAAGGSLNSHGGVWEGTVAAPFVINGSFYGTGATLLSVAGVPGTALSIQNANAVASCIDCAITYNGGAGSSAIAWTANGKVILKGNTTVTGGATEGSLNNGANTGAIVYAEPTVKFSPTTFPNFTGIWTGPDVHLGSCTGTATSSLTLGIYGLGESATTTCTSINTNAGYVATQVGATGVIALLQVTAGTGGVNSSSGVFTVLKNGSTTTITCTIGTGTSCTDNTHSVSYVLGDIISVQFTTQALETLANVKVSVLTL